jgi:hypothetical protein
MDRHKACTPAQQPFVRQLRLSSWTLRLSFLVSGRAPVLGLIQLGACLIPRILQGHSYSSHRKPGFTSSYSPDLPPPLPTHRPLTPMNQVCVFPDSQ